MPHPDDTTPLELDDPPPTERLTAAELRARTAEARAEAAWARAEARDAQADDLLRRLGGTPPPADPAP